MQELLMEEQLQRFSSRSRIKKKKSGDYQLDIKETNLEIKDIQKKLNNQTIKSTLNGVVKTVGDPEKESNDGKPLIQVVSSEGLYVQGTVSDLK